MTLSRQSNIEQPAESTRQIHAETNPKTNNIKVTFVKKNRKT